jgi:ABC-type nitrate/sulfonate/bicarbonate transport system permease component
LSSKTEDGAVRDEYLDGVNEINRKQLEPQPEEFASVCGLHILQVFISARMCALLPAILSGARFSSLRVKKKTNIDF